MFHDFAPAKVNLCLHVTGQRADGYHLLDSVVVFADVGDDIAFTPDRAMSLEMSGTFGAPAGEGPDNLVWRAAQLAGVQGHIRLDKRLPVAAGLGGGSSDAAAMLRIAAKVTGQGFPERTEQLGADVPVCLTPKPQRMQGIGEVLSPLPDLPECWIVLVNPRVPVPTGAVFSALPSKSNAPIQHLPDSFGNFDELITWLRSLRNDLEGPAKVVAPVIVDVLNEIGATDGCALARMSGSGATCFGLFETEESAAPAALKLQASNPDFWVTHARLMK